MRSRSNSRDRAFSLPELVIAMAVLSIGVITAMQALAFSVRVTGLVSDIVDAGLLVNDKMQDFEYKESQGLVRTEIQDGAEEHSGKFGLSTHKDAGTSVGSMSLYKVSVDITWTRAGRNEGFKVISTYFNR